MRDRIERIEGAGSSRRARRLAFASGSVLITSASVVSSLALAAGDEVDMIELAEAMSQAARDCARERALRIVGYRERSRHQVAHALLDEGYPPEVVIPLVDRFVDLGLVDDARFARLFAASRIAAGRGDRVIRHELKHAGVDVSIIAQIGAELIPAAGRDRAVKALGSRSVETPRDRERQVRRLMARGFSLDDAREAVSRARDAATADTGEDCET